MSKIHFWDLFTCKGTYMIDWVGRMCSDTIHYTYIYVYIHISIYTYVVMQCTQVV